MIDSSAKNALFSSENRERVGLHYLGISLILAWYYCLWFTPNFFTSTPITDTNVTFSWLSTLAFTGVAFLVTPMAFRKIRFYDHQKAIPAIAGVMGVATFAFGVLGFALESPVLALVVFPLVFAVCNAVFWIAWGEFHARRKSNFSLSKFAFIFGSVMLPSAIVASLLPHYVVDVFVAAFPVISAFAYIKENQGLGDRELPTLLPKATRAKTSKATAAISIVIFFTCVGCYFNIAIIPESTLLPDGLSYVLGIVGAALVCLVISIVQKITKRSIASYRLLPWLVVTCIVALAVFVNGNPERFDISFVITVTLAGVFEVFLIAYFGALSNKGHLSPIFAFAISSAIVRLGFFAGDTWAVIYEHNALLAENFTQGTSLLLLCVLAAMLVPLLHKENMLVQLTQAPAGPSEIEEVCDAAIEEFSLSKREGEILKYIARGYTVDNISKKLVISPYTTQTHVRHIYSKMHVYKRSELLDYINMHRSENND